MILMLMRHGEAESVFSRDPERALTEAGEIEVVNAAEELRRRGLVPGRVIASPYVRARQTAELVTQHLALTAPTFSELLTPDAEAVQSVSMLADFSADCQSALAVLHQPLVSRLILYLTGNVQPMSTSNVAVLEGELLERGTCDLKCVL